MTGQAALPGMDAGKRTERVEWGLRWTTDTVFGRRGTVEPRPDEANARKCEGVAEWGWRGTEVVSRTVVTYTTPWETT